MPTINPPQRVRELLYYMSYLRNHWVRVTRAGGEGDIFDISKMPCAFNQSSFQSSRERKPEVRDVDPGH